MSPTGEDDTGKADTAEPRSFVVMAAAALVATALVLGIMWMKDLRYESASGRPVAEQQ